MNLEMLFEEFRLFSEGDREGGLIDITVEISFAMDRDWYVSEISVPGYSKGAVPKTDKPIYLDHAHPIYALICTRLESPDYEPRISEAIGEAIAEARQPDPDYLYERRRDDAMMESWS